LCKAQRRSKLTARITESEAVVERGVTPVNACLVAAIIQAIIEVDIALVAADCRTGAVFSPPKRNEHQTSGQDRKQQTPSHQFREFRAKHRCTP
jgi:ethanolamine utilization microcompartment shell protein EutL